MRRRRRQKQSQRGGEWRYLYSRKKSWRGVTEIGGLYSQGTFEKKKTREIDIVGCANIKSQNRNNHKVVKSFILL